MVIIYHSRDLDGFSSGAICKKKYPNAKLIGFDYGQPFPYDQVERGEEVIMIDVSLKMPEMMDLSEYCDGKLTWIDHHKSAIDDFLASALNDGSEHYPIGIDIYRSPKIQAVLKVGRSACEIAWLYYFSDTPIPYSIQLLGEYDTWRNENKNRWEQEILPFQFGIRLFCNSPETFPEQLLEQVNYPNTEYSYHHIMAQGITVLKYQAQVNERQCKSASFEFEIEGLRAICVNGGGFNSDVFKSVYDESKHDIMVPFQFNGKFWVVSFYSVKKEVDCSVVARKFGGGGHAGAAGCQLASIQTIFPFIKSEK
jgi:hypothetical protein